MTSYSTNFTDSQWQVIAPLLNPDRKRKQALREIVNAIFYLVKTGCHWRLLPHDLPDWRIVYYYFAAWKKLLLIETLHALLVEKTRLAAGKKEEPTAAIIDSQSVKTTLVSTENKGFDAGKKIKGIKRHLITDPLGLILAVIAHSAGEQDRTAAERVVAQLVANGRRVVKLFADGGYQGKLEKRIKKLYGITMVIVKRTAVKVFEGLLKRWIVERTFACMDTNRRNSKYYERLESTGVAMMHMSAIRRMLKKYYMNLHISTPTNFKQSLKAKK